MIQDYLLPVGLLSGVGLLAGVALVLAAKFMAVSTDEKFELVRALLPGANCGACGYAGCDDYAAKVAEGKAEVNLCLPGGDSAARRIALTLGRGEVKVVPKTAVVACSCGYTGENTKMRYHGRHSCVAASLFYKGNLTCDHGCLGFGDCVQACKFNAISIQNGLAVVDKKRCTGCGKCAMVCPHQVIWIRPHAAHIHVACINPESGAATRRECKYGCIGCHKCEKVCPTGAIKLQGNIAWTFPELCTKCGACVEACPVGVIRDCFRAAIEKADEPAAVTAVQ